MTTAELLRSLHRAGVHMTVDAGDLLLHNATGLDPALVAAVRANKQALIDAIGAADPTDRAVDVVADPAARHLLFPLSDLQRAYVFSRDLSVPLGGIGCHAYFEFDLPEVDPTRLEAAWRRVVATEDVLRLVIVEGREQMILPMPTECPLTIADLRTVADPVVEATRMGWREQMTAHVHDPGIWPLWDLRLTLLPNGAGRLHAEFDLIAADAAALYGVLTRLAQIYAGKDAPEASPFSFRDVQLAASRATAEEESAARWWAERLPHLPSAPELPVRAPLATLTPPRFHRYRTELEASRLEQLEAQASTRNLTLAAILNAAFAESVARHCSNERFLLNLPVFLPSVRIPAERLPLGNYTSNILVAADTTGGDFTTRAARLAREVMTALSRRAYSGARVLHDLARHRGGGLEPGAPVVLTNLLAHRQQGEASPLPGAISFGVSRTPQVLIDHQIVPTPDGITFHWDFVDQAFAEELVPAMAWAHLDLLDRLADGLTWDDPGSAGKDLASPPVLPTVTDAASRRAPTITEAGLTVDESNSLRDAADRHDVDLETALLAACAETIARWSETPCFTLAVPAHQKRRDWYLCPVDSTRLTSFTDRVDQWRTRPTGRGFLGAEAGVVLRRLGGVNTAGPGGAPVSVAVSFAAADVGAAEVNETDVGWADVSCRIIDVGGAIATTWRDDVDRCADGVLASMAAGLVGALRRLSDDARWTQPLDILPTDQVAQRASVNATARAIEPALLHDGFVAAARTQPDSLALAAPGMRLTYGELDERTERLAATLRSKGVRPNELVAILLEDNHRQVEAAVAVVKAGAAYVPIDACWPSRRKVELLRRCRARLAVIRGDSAAGPDWPSGVEPVDIDAAIDSGSLSPVTASSCPDDLAYVIFTSGSTGEPKGVAIEHAAAVNTITDMIERFGVKPDDRVLGLSAFAFDLSVFDIFGTLAAGATLVLPRRAAEPDPEHWHERMVDESVTVWNSVPALMELLVTHLDRAGDSERAALRQCWLSGDWIPLTLPDRVRRAFPAAEVISLGGATEAAIWSIYHRIGLVDPRWRSIPYGQPLGNQRWHVLDDAGQPRPDGVPGDLYIAGAGLARGYWDDPERTAASFSIHPQLHERLYRTGDRGRYHPDGTIEFLGRRDTQVKVRGHRIELGEIEAVLSQHSAVRQALATVRRTSTGADRLAAWVTLRDDAAMRSDELDRHLRDRLPSYMVPALRIVEALPLTANGKLDRAALPDPFDKAGADDHEGPVPTEAAAASDAMAAELCALIGETLGCALPAPEDDLIDLGASSMDVVTLVGEIQRRYGFRPSYQDFFRDPTVAALVRMAHAVTPVPSAPPSAVSTPAAPAPTALPQLIDPTDREAFKRAAHGIRTAPAGRDPIRLPRLSSHGDPHGDLIASFMQRRAVRHFLPRPVPLEAFSGWLALLSSASSDGTRKHVFGSAGGLYSVQTYVHLKPDGVAGCPPGIFYHHPLDHSLVPTTIGAEIERDVHDPFVNKPVFDNARFSVFFISSPDAIEPMYGELAQRFSTLEAGAMAQTLETAAAQFGLGVCPIGWLDFATIAPLFQLEPGQAMLHSLAGGLLDPSGAPVEAPADDWQEGEL